MKTNPLLRGGVALVAALLLAGFVLHASARPRLYSELLVTTKVPIGTQVTAEDLGTLWTIAPPVGAIALPLIILLALAKVQKRPG